MAGADEISPEALLRASALLEKSVDRGEVVGVSHLVMLDGEVVHLSVEGSRDIEDETPMAEDTIVRIYSMTKPITSVAAMILFERRRFSLDDPIADYIPAFEKVRVSDSEGDRPPERPISVRDVFLHTTGYSYGDGALLGRYVAEGLRYRPPHDMMPPAMTIEDAAEALARVPLAHDPGERFTYGYSTDLLGRLVEVWAEEPLDLFMRREVFDRLGMVDTGFNVPEEKRARFASCHVWEGGSYKIADKAATSPFNDGFDFLSGGGGLVSTLRDYANFCEMISKKGVFNGERILKETTVDLMFTDQLGDTDAGFQFGLGFAINDFEVGGDDNRRTVKQYSWGGYASTDFRIVPEEGLVQVVFRQRLPTSPDLANQLFRIIYSGIQ